jgi:tetratricopeptide (TPR) repeat protein/cellulose biosynthesis protein BcsQ
MDSLDRRGQVVTFYSFKGGVGRTMALANIAWILASSGRRVLAVDWDLESPGLHRYFAPFLADRDLRQSPGVINAIQRFADVTANGPVDLDEVHRLAQVKRYAVSLERFDFPDDGMIDYISPGQQGADYSRAVSTFDWEDFYLSHNGEDFLLALADDMRRNYDVALIDSRTGLSDNAGICTVTLPDTVVNCFAFSNQSIDGAVAVSRSILADPSRPRDIRIIPVPSRVEDGEAAKLDRRRRLAQQRFAEFVAALGHDDPSRYWGAVELPYKLFYAYEETLAAFGDPPYQQNTLLSAYERLAGEIVGEPVTFAGLPEPVRRGWLAEFEHRGSANTGTLVIGYTPRDRIWAEWISHQLRLVGQRSSMRDLNHAPPGAAALDRAERTVVLLSREATREPKVLSWWETAVAKDVPGHGRFVVPVRVDGYPLPDPFDQLPAVDMFNVAEAHARDSLLARLDLRDALPVSEPIGGGSSPRFPFTPARVWKVPARNPGFIGRDADLEQLRERLNASTAQTGPAVLQGIGGVGKTQIAIEYVHRFAADYDIAWWISAEQPALVLTALADLAKALDLPVTDRASDQASAVLEALRLGNPSAKWVIVFDNTDNPNDIRPFVPSGPGDVIITTPGQDWSREAWTLDVNVFYRSESVGMLMRRVEGLTETDAQTIAGKLGDLPLAIEQASNWLSTTAMTADDYLDLLDEHLPRILDESPPPGYPHPAAQTWRLSQERLRERSPAAAHLAELCAFFAPEPIPIRFLDGPGMVELLTSDDASLRDRLNRAPLVREITRFGLARVDSALNALRMHRLVQTVLRSKLSAQEQKIRRGQVQMVLASEVRGEPDDRENWSTYQGLLTHLEPSGALESDDLDSHLLVIDIVRYLRHRGDLAGALGLAERAIAAWERRLGPDDGSVLRMISELGNIRFARGEYAEALALQQRATVRLAEVLGENRPYTLIAQAGLAAAHRALGEYTRSRELDERSVVAWQTVQGDDHPRTLMATYNLGISLRLVGDFEGGLRQDEELVRRAELRLGPRHLLTLGWRISHGRDLREVGDLHRSLAILERALADSQEDFGEHQVTRAATKNLVVTLRRLGRAAECVEPIQRVLDQAERALGLHHPTTLSYALEASCVSSALGDHTGARHRAEQVLKLSQQHVGADNPSTLATSNDLGIFLLRANEQERALTLLNEIAPKFVSALGADHPYTLTCQVNLANALWAAGRIEEVHKLDEHCYDLLRARLNHRHPVVLVAAGNLAISRLRTGDPDQAVATREEALRIATEQLGHDHPNVRAIREGSRVNVDIEPQEYL